MGLEVVSDEEVEEEEEEADEEVAHVYNERNEMQRKLNKRYHNVINLMVCMSIQLIQIKNTVHVLSI